MSDVSSRAVRGLLEAALLDGLFTRSAVDDPSERLDWDVVAELLARLEAAAGGPATVASLCERFAANDVHIAAMAALLLEPQRFYRFVNELVWPTLCAPVSVTHRSVSDTAFSVEAKPLPGYRGSSSIAHVTTGHLRAQPSWLGLPHAVVDGHVSARRREWLVPSSAEGPLSKRLRRALVARDLWPRSSD